MSNEAGVRLLPHPSDAPSPVRTIAVSVEREASRLRLRYRLAGDLGRVRVPAPASPSFALGLWEHTCAEAFIALDGSPAYHELNFSPSGEWAAFSFADTRALSPTQSEVAPPRVSTRTDDDALDLDVVLALASLAPAYASAPLRMGLSAVVEADDGSLSHWSLVHPADRPDFHHRATRTLPLAPPRSREE